MTEISTYGVAELTAAALGLKVTADEVVAVWYGIGKFVNSQLIARKGVKLSGFGMFSLSPTMSPVFIASTEFTSQFKIRQISPIASAPSIPTTLLNFAYLAQACNLERDKVEKIFNKFISTLGRCVGDKRLISLTVHKVAEIHIGGGELLSDFLPDFILEFRSDPLRQSKVITKSISQMRPSSRPRSNSGFSSQSNLGTIRSSTPTITRRNSTSTLTSNMKALVREPQQPRSREQNLLNPREVAARAVNSSSLESIVDRVRKKIVERGGSGGIRTISRLLMIMDDNGDKKLSKDELRYGLRDYGIDLNPSELEQVFQYFDRDRNGYIEITEFLVGLRGEMNNRRKSLIRMAFDIIDFDRSGIITVDEIMQRYDFSKDPDVRDGKKTVQQAARAFMLTWDRGDKNGEVTYDEFEDYYKDISASIDDDDYFELMMRNAWRIPGGKGMASNTANRRVLVTKADGSQSVETIENELGLKANDLDGMRSRLKQQGVDSTNIDLYGYQDSTSKPQQNKPSRDTGFNPITGALRTQTLNMPAPPPTQPTQTQNVSSRTLGRTQGFGNPNPPQPPQESSKRTQHNASAVPAYSINSPDEALALLREVLYNPPVSLEQLCNKLQVSLASNNPRMAMGAFKARIGTLNCNIDKNAMNAIWKAVDPSNLGSLEIVALHNTLAGRFGKDKSAGKSSGVIERAKDKILERCGGQAGIKGLARVLLTMDSNGDKQLSKEELKYGLQDYGIELNIRELEELFGYFDKDRSGRIDLTEFLVGMRGDLNERRKQFVRLAFNILDKDRSGTISIDEVAAVYDVSANPDVISGKKTKDQALREFMATWEQGSIDGLITYDEFEDYYKEISASIDGDDYFELMMRNAWRIPGGKGMAANTANRRVLVTKADGSQSVETIENELGLKANDLDGMRSRLKQQGVDSTNIDLYGYQDNTSKPQQAKNSHILDNTHNRTAYDRHMAAMKVAAVYRGKLARKKVEAEKRKVDAVRRQKEEELAEANRPKPRQIIRPKGKSYIGF